jgi:hypothetical protein
MWFRARFAAFNPVTTTDEIRLCAVEWGHDAQLARVTQNLHRAIDHSLGKAAIGRKRCRGRISHSPVFSTLRMTSKRWPGPTFKVSAK